MEQPSRRLLSLFHRHPRFDPLKFPTLGLQSIDPSPPLSLSSPRDPISPLVDTQSSPEQNPQIPVTAVRRCPSAEFVAAAEFLCPESKLFIMFPVPRHVLPPCPSSSGERPFAGSSRSAAGRRSGTGSNPSGSCRRGSPCGGRFNCRGPLSGQAAFSPSPFHVYSAPQAVLGPIYVLTPPSPPPPPHPVQTKRLFWVLRPNSYQPKEIYFYLQKVIYSKP